jgi:hypothetical protein
VVAGDRILGRFVIGERLGQGGFGVVHRAWDERLERLVAVKEITGGDPRRILREAQAAARLNHRAIVTLYELGGEGSRAYLVSELIEGTNLRRATQGGRLSDRDVALIGAELCAALAHSHGRGVVHRDIKPENVIVLAGGRARARVRAKLMDFGTAQVRGAPTLTLSGGALGTIAYMAPEQAEGITCGPAADVYSLGLVLYECWAGGNPVARATPAATARAIGSELASLGEARPDLPQALCAGIDACLAADPEHRPTLAELSSALRSDARSLDPDAAVPDPRGEAAGGTRRRAGSPPRLLLATAAALVALVALGRPGTALVLAVLLVPALVLVPGPRAWALPLVAPVLGAIGLAPLYVVAASLAGRSAASRAVLGALGVLVLAITAPVLGWRSPLGALTQPDAGWSGSAADAAALLAAAASPDALALAAIWATAAAMLGTVLALRSLGLRPVLAIVWAAGLVAAYRALASAPGSTVEAAGGTLALVLALAVLALAAASTARDARGAGRRGGPAQDVASPPVDSMTISRRFAPARRPRGTEAPLP